MRNTHLTHCLVVGLVVVALVLALDLPSNGLLVAAAVLACPLLMVVMMRSMAAERPRHDSNVRPSD